MKYKSYARRKQLQQDLFYALLAILGVLLIMGFVGWLESQDQRAKYEHCMFLAMPDETIEQVKECALQTHYFPKEYLQTLQEGVK